MIRVKSMFSAPSLLVIIRGDAAAAGTPANEWSRRAQENDRARLIRIVSQR